MKQQYLKLRNEGKTYKEISEITGRTISTIHAALNEETKAKGKSRLRIFRENRLLTFKDSVGSYCSVCGYNRCKRALELHHVDASLKRFEISDAIYQKVKVTQEEIELELKKCILICSNCHRELHDGLITLQS